MFKKSDKGSDNDSSTFSRVAPNFEVRTRSASVIGPTLRIKGELSANEDLIIEGEIEGKIAHQDKNLTVGKSGRVKADIHAKVVEILGYVDGDIRADDIVKLAKSSEVSGNIQCARIAMEDGARFSGMIKMEERRTEPTSIAPVDSDADDDALDSKDTSDVA